MEKNIFPDPAGQSTPAVAARRAYTGKDLAFLIPTKDRPHDIENLLKSLAAQSIACGRVIIVDGGKSIEALVAGYRDRLPVDYYPCQPPGQIRQRNLGIGKLDDTTALVGFLDDDLVLEPDALEKMIAFWNGAEPATAGVGFNIVNAPPARASFLARLLLMSSAEPGRVLRSGYNSRIDSINADLRTQWLGGGYTVWKREILHQYPQSDLKTRWAIGEDLRYSYPIGKAYPLHVCAAARVRHEYVYDQAPAQAIDRYRGRKSSLSIFYFVTLHEELSRWACLWMLTGKLLAYAAKGCFTLDARALLNAVGQAEAIGICVKSWLGFADLQSELED
jgi:glycosyltransferase involved in cell wall biosynthesis